MKPILVIGSLAASYDYQDLDKFRYSLENRFHSDIDLIGDYDSICSWIKKSSDRINALYPVSDGKKLFASIVLHSGHKRIVEAELTWLGTTAKEIYDFVLNSSYPISSKLGKVNSLETDMVIPTFDILYTLKHSHRFKDHVSFEKTRKFIKEHEDKYKNQSLSFYPWYERRKKESERVSPSLNMSKKEFFREDESYNIYDHDDIHEAVKISRCPAYKLFTKGEVLFDIEKFREASEGTKLAAVFEESAVLALERIYIPNGMIEDFDFDGAFKTSLRKVCTVITSGYFREFAYNNYDKILHFQKSYDYLGKFKKALELGEVRKFSN